MAQSPIKRDFTIKRRADFPLKLIFKDSNNTKVNLTGFTVAAQVWNDDRSTKFADWTVAYTNRTNGEFEISLTHVQTTQFTPNELSYDVLLLNPSGKREYYIEGTIFVSEGYTTI